MDTTEWVKIGVELIGMGVVALCAFYAVRSQVEVLSVRYEMQNESIKAIQVEIVKISQIITDQKLIEQRAVNLELRVVNIEQDIRLMRKGEGFVFPFEFKNRYEKP